MAERSSWSSTGSRSATRTSRSWWISRSAIPAGSITTIIGPNGAGKSTLLRAIYGLNRHFGGSVRFFGRAIETLPPRGAIEARHRLRAAGPLQFPADDRAREPRARRLYPARPGGGRRPSSACWRSFPCSRPSSSVLAGNLSGGEQQILEIAMVLEAAPKLLLLDEPSLGLSPAQPGPDLRDHRRSARPRPDRAGGRAERPRRAADFRHRHRHGTGPHLHGWACRAVIADPRIKVAYLGGGENAAR